MDTNIHLGRITAHNAVHLSLSRFVAKSPREQQLATQALHQRRLRIDPVYSRVKRCRSVKDWSRLWKQGVSDLTMALGCALHTFRVRLPPMAANTLSGINSPKSAERPRHSCRGWIGVGRAGLNAQEPNKTHAVPEPLMGEGTA